MVKNCMLCNLPDNLEKEDSLLICTKCGVVVDEEIFQNDEDLKESKYQSNSNEFCNLMNHSISMKRELASNDFRTESRRQAKQMLYHCINHFRFSNIMKEEAKTLFIKLINSTHFYHCSSKTKIILSGVCTYLIMVKFDYVITKNLISKVIGCNVFEFGAVYKRTLNHTNVSKPKFFTIDQYITNTVNNVPFNHIEIAQIQNIVSELINLQRNCCLIDGKFPPNIILAASFYAWKLVDLKERLKVTLKQFQTRFKISCNLKIYVPRLIEFLIDLCKLIPWITDKKKINKKTVYFYTQDLLNYPNSIIADYLKLKKEQTDQQIRTQEDNLKRIKKEQTGFSLDLDDDEINKNDLNLSNISDSEIDSYIRTAEEVRVLKKIYKNGIKNIL